MCGGRKDGDLRSSTGVIANTDRSAPMGVVMYVGGDAPNFVR